MDYIGHVDGIDGAIGGDHIIIIMVHEIGDIVHIIIFIHIIQFIIIGKKGISENV